MPRITNISPGYRGVNTTTGLVILAPNEARQLELSDDELKDLSEEWFKVRKVADKELAKEADEGAAQPSGHDDSQSQPPAKKDEQANKSAATAPATRAEAFEAALKAMPESGYDAEGKPKLAAVNAVMPEGATPLNAKELDSLWADKAKG